MRRVTDFGDKIGMQPNLDL